MIIIFNDVDLKIKKHNKILFTRDSDCLQELRKLICLQKHTTLIMWIFDCLQIPLDEIKTAYPNESESQAAFMLSDLWARGEVKMPVAKRAILDCHAVAKSIDNDYFIALYHAVGQGFATVHVETHALGLVFYELTAIVIKNNYQNYQYEVTKKIQYYMNRLLWWQENIEVFEHQRSWANFLVKPNKPNKEALLYVNDTHAKGKL